MRMPDNIRYYREQAGMYQSDLGKALGVSAQAVSKWELAKAEPDRDSIEKMCGLFKVSADTLMDIHVLDMKPATVEPALTEAEKSLISNFRSLSPDGQAYILQTMAMAINTMGQNETVSVVGAG